MQDPSAFTPMRPPPFPEQERLKCPRCESNNTKFCYYNNYNLSQPRHFCKNCRRYWTKGGALRNIPVGGGTRKNAKRPAAATANSDGSNSKRPEPGSEPEQKYQNQVAAPSPSQPTPGTSVIESSRSYFPDLDPARIHAMGGGSFSSLLASNMQFGSILEGRNSTGSGPKMVQLGGFGKVENLDSKPVVDWGRGPERGLSAAAENKSGSESERYLSLQNGGDSNCWGNGSSSSSSNWPDLSIYTPSSRFQ